MSRKIYTDEELRLKKNERSRQRYLDNKNRIAAYHSARYQRLKETPGFLENQAKKAAEYRKANPHKVSEQNAKRRAADPEKARRESREWFAKHPEKRAAYQLNRKARQKHNGGKLSPDLKARLFNLQRGMCACCKAKLEINLLHMDHIVPLSQGGPNCDLNIQLLCQPCNQHKHAKHPIDFMQGQGFLL